MEQHPLLIDVIIANLAQYLDYSLLKGARCVCHNWNDALLPLFRKKTKLSIFFDEENKSSPEFLSIFSSQNHHRRFKLVQIGLPEFLIPLRGFWLSSCGSFIKNLTLGCTIPYLSGQTTSESMILKCSSLRLILLEWCTNIKTLKLLNLIYQEDNNPHNPSLLSLDYLEILVQNRWPNVHSIRRPNLVDIPSISQDVPLIFHNVFQYLDKVNKLSYQMDDDYYRLKPLQYIIDLPKIQIIENLDILNLSGCWSIAEEILPLLISINFKKLKVLHLGGLKKFYSTEIPLFEEFLQSLCLTLEELYVSWSFVAYTSDLTSGRKYEEITLPIMPKLRVFNQFPLANLSISTLDILTRFPRLNHFEVDTWKNSFFVKTLFTEKLSYHSLRHNPHMHLMRLNLDDVCIGNNELIIYERITQSFPNLQKFSTTYSGTSLKQVFLLLSSLEDLRCFYIKCSGRLEDMQEAIVSNLPELKNLQKLHMDCKQERPWRDHPLRIRLDSFLIGFFKLPSLEDLIISDCEIFADEYKILESFLVKMTKSISIQNFRLLNEDDTTCCDNGSGWVDFPKGNDWFS